MASPFAIKPSQPDTFKSFTPLYSEQFKLRGVTEQISPFAQPPKEEPVKEEPKTSEKTEVNVETPKVIKYTVVQGDTLEQIAAKHQTTVERLFNKNTQIGNANLINVGDIITIPASDEMLTERKVTAPAIQYRQASSSNTYVYGWCTWYAKERRPDIGGFWGDARNWINSARNSGYSVGSVPVAGSIGVSYSGGYGHVVYVESVSGSTITVSDMNGPGGFGVIMTYQTSASSYSYIY